MAYNYYLHNTYDLMGSQGVVSIQVHRRQIFEDGAVAKG